MLDTELRLSDFLDFRAGKCNFFPLIRKEVVEESASRLAKIFIFKSTLYGRR